MLNPCQSAPRNGAGKRQIPNANLQTSAKRKDSNLKWSRLGIPLAPGRERT